MGSRKNKPNIRFNGFNDAWEQRKLGDMGDTFTGLSGKTKEDFGKGEAEFITYLNVFNNPISNIKLTERVELDKKQNEVRYGDIFFTTSSETPGEVGMSSVWLDNRENVYLNSFCFGYRLKDKVDPFYMAYSLRSNPIRNQFILLAQGISRYNISKTKAMDIEIMLPKLDEQIKLGKFFKQLDNLITLHQRKLDNLETLKKTFLNKMFPINGEKIPELRFKGSTDAWEQRKLSDVVSLFGGNAFSSHDSVDGGARWLKIANVGTGQLKWNDESFLPISYLDEYSAYRLKIGDYVMALTRPILNHELKIAEITEEDILLNQRVAKLIFADDAKFGYQLLRKCSVVEMIENEMAGTDPPNLSVNILNHIDVRVPNLAEQEKISSLFNNLDNLITLHQRKIEQLQQMKQYFLKNMFA